MAKLLLSAYACRPNTGSEPGVGWNFALRVAASHHDVWVVTRADNRESIEQWRRENPTSLKNLHFVYHDVPRWVHLLFPGNAGNQVRYMVWQSTLLRTVRPLHEEVGFDVAQHITYVRYWTASRLVKLPGVPFVWGPVGGAESAPKAFKPGLGFKGRMIEFVRETARRVAELDPRVHTVASRAALSIATTEETADRLRAMGATNVLQMPEAGLPREEIEALLAPEPAPGEPFAFISMARLLYWKGFHLGLAAFAQAKLPGRATSWSATARRCHGSRRMRSDWGLRRASILSAGFRATTMARLAKCHVLVHPSLHDSGGWVCLEAMASARPVICLDLGGPATQVTDETGFRIHAGTPEQAIADMASAMRKLYDHPDLRRRMSAAGPKRVMDAFCWDEKVRRMNAIYAELMAATTTATKSGRSPLATPVL